MPVRKFYQYDRGDDSVYGFRVGRFNLGINTTFILYRIGNTLIDTGPTNQWKDIRLQLKDTDIQQLLITHHHEDHAGNTQRIAEMKGIVPLAPALGQAKIASGFKTPVMQKLIWGSPVPAKTDTMPEEFTLTDGSPVIAVHTPGHAKDLTCLFLPKQKYLFSGDMYISRSLKYMRADENLEQLMDGLRKLLKLDFEIVFCPHNGIVEDGKAALQDKLNNLEAMCQKAAAYSAEGLTEEQVIEKLVGPEDMLSKLSRYNISKGNLVRQAIEIGRK